MIVVDLYERMFDELGITVVQVTGIEMIRQLDELADVHIVNFNMGKHHELGYVGPSFSVHGVMDNPELFGSPEKIRNYFVEHGFDVPEHKVVGDNRFKNVDLTYLHVYVTLHPGSIRVKNKPVHILDHYWHKLNSQ